MADPITAHGGRMKWNTGESIGATDLERMGQIASQSLFHTLARFFRNNTGDPQSGFFGDDCLVSAVGGLDVQVAAGLGLIYDAAESDGYDTHYKPIVVAAADVQTLAAHDPSNPRIDLVALAPATADEDSQTDQVKDPGTGAVSSQSINKRVRHSYALQVVQGTPAASPSAPATPAGYLAVAEVTVPAGAGALTVADARDVLVLTTNLTTNLTAVAAGDDGAGDPRLQVNDTVGVRVRDGMDVLTGDVHVYETAQVDGDFDVDGVTTLDETIIGDPSGLTVNGPTDLNGPVTIADAAGLDLNGPLDVAGEATLQQALHLQGKVLLEGSGFAELPRFIDVSLDDANGKAVERWVSFTDFSHLNYTNVNISGDGAAEGLIHSTSGTHSQYLYLNLGPLFAQQGHATEGALLTQVTFYLLKESALSGGARFVSKFQYLDLETTADGVWTTVNTESVDAPDIDNTGGAPSAHVQDLTAAADANRMLKSGRLCRLEIQLFGDGTNNSPYLLGAKVEGLVKYLMP